ncbi:Uncharacterised protein [Legionella spiritensis]|nr:Uncharacterised protein [Legionella spiritensis]
MILVLASTNLLHPTLIILGWLGNIVRGVTDLSVYFGI